MDTYFIVVCCSANIRCPKGIRFLQQISLVQFLNFGLFFVGKVLYLQFQVKEGVFNLILGSGVSYFDRKGLTFLFILVLFVVGSGLCWDFKILSVFGSGFIRFDRMWLISEVGRNLIVTWVESGDCEPLELEVWAAFARKGLEQTNILQRTMLKMRN